MKSLETIQKTANVFRIICRIIMVFSFVGAGICLVTAGLWGYVYSQKDAGDAVISRILESMGGDASLATLAELMRDFTVCLTQGILLAFAHKYLVDELQAGTPFTQNGAELMKKLGIKTIILPIIAIIICAVINKCCSVSSDKYVSNGFSVAAGVGMILFSLILRYGAELEAKKSADRCQVADEVEK